MINQLVDRLSIRLNKIVVVTIILVVFFFYIATRVNKPSENLVNGSYYNPCCEVVVIRDDYIIYRGQKVQFTLENMKTGLTAWTNGKLSLSGIQLPQKKHAFETETIPFREINGTMTFSLLANNQDVVVFRKID